MLDSNPGSAEGSDGGQVSEATIKQVRSGLMEIAMLAWAVQQLMIDAECSAGSQPANATIVSGTVLAEKIGFIADLCAHKIGGSTTRGDAEDWFLPPAYHWSTNPPEIAGARA